MRVFRAELAFRVCHIVSFNSVKLGRGHDKHVIILAIPRVISLWSMETYNKQSNKQIL